MDRQAEFARDLASYWHCEVRGPDLTDALLRTLSNPRHPLKEEDFRQLLAQAIRERRYSVQEYEALTGLDFETADEVAQDLRQLWRQLYGDAAELP
jgi:hypothetical protein